MWPRPTTKRDRPTSASALTGGKPARPPVGHKSKRRGHGGRGNGTQCRHQKVTGGEKQKSKHDIEGGNNNKKLKLTKFVLLHSKPIREDNKIFEDHVPSTIKCTPKVQRWNEENHTQKGAKMGRKSTAT